METINEVRNVLVAVDVQNDFINGSLAVEGGEEVVSPINEVADAVRATNGSVAFTRDWHPHNTRHFDDWPVHCVRHTEGAAFHPGLTIEPSDIIISKGTGRLQHGYSGWEGKSSDGLTLESITSPRSLGEKVRVFIGGLATDYCVKATGLSVANHFRNNKRVETYLLRDAVRAVNKAPTDGDEAYQALLDAGLIALSSEEARELITGELSNE